MAPHVPPVFIVTVDGPTERFSRRLAELDGARLVRELPPRRVVVVLRSHADRARLAALPGVEAVVLDEVRHLHGLA